MDGWNGNLAANNFFHISLENICRLNNFYHFNLLLCLLEVLQNCLPRNTLASLCQSCMVCLQSPSPPFQLPKPFSTISHPSIWIDNVNRKLKSEVIIWNSEIRKQTTENRQQKLKS